MNGWSTPPKNGDLDKWMYRVQLASTLVANVGFPILVSCALLLVIWRMLPTLDKLNDTIERVSQTLDVENATLSSENLQQLKIIDLLTAQQLQFKDHEDALRDHDRKTDQYHQDYMLLHHAPLPDDPIPPRRHR